MKISNSKAIYMFVLVHTTLAAIIPSLSPTPRTSLSPATASSTVSIPSPISTSSSKPAASTSPSTTTPTTLSVNLDVIKVTQTDEGGETMVTTAPVFDGDVESRMVMVAKWHLTTFWSCKTWDATFTDCGWHEPVLPGGTEIAGAPRAMDARCAALMAGAVAMVGALL